MKQCLRQDFLYYIRKMYLPFFVLLNVVLCVSTLYNGHMTANSDLDDYISAKSNYEKGIASSFAYPDGDVIEVESEDGIEILKNKAEHSVAAICPQYSIEYSMISILMLSLIVMSIFGISYELLDGKNNIMRIKVARFKRRDIFVAKQMMLLFFTLITMIVSILLSYIVNKVLFLKLLRKYPIVKEFDFNMYLYKNDWIKKIVVFTIAIILSVELGAMIARVVKNELIASIIVVVYGMVIPVLGKYDIKACIGEMMIRYFNCLGSISVTSNRAGNIYLCLIVCGIFIIGCIIANYYVYKKRSAY